MHKISVLVGGAVLALGGFTACRPVPAVACGTVLTHDIRLTADIGGCAGDGLIVGADDITVDLGGHAVASAGGVGLRLAGRDGVTVRGGTVSGSTVGLSLADARNLTVRQIRASGPEGGVLLTRVRTSAISHTLGEGFNGFRLVDSHGNRIRSARADRFDGDDSNNGIRLETSSSNTITGGTFDAGDDENIYLIDSDANVIVGNDASNSNTVGILLRRSDRNVLRRNVVGSEAGAVSLEDSADNVLVDNGNQGASGGGPGTQIEVIRSDRTALRRNQVEAISVTASADVVLTGNRLVSRGSFLSDGIIVSADAPGALLAHNQSSGFSDDGFQIDAPGTVLRGNSARDNGDLGIEAVPGVTDRGGNIATGNGNPVQCTNVTCRSGV